MEKHITGTLLPPRCFITCPFLKHMVYSHIRVDILKEQFYHGLHTIADFSLTPYLESFTPTFGLGLLISQECLQIYIVGLLFFPKDVSGTPIFKILVRTLDRDRQKSGLDVIYVRKEDSSVTRVFILKEHSYQG